MYSRPTNVYRITDCCIFIRQDKMCLLCTTYIEKWVYSQFIIIRSMPKKSYISQ